jgi:cytidylate kinase
MPIVTIRGQLGSGATEIGKLLADRLKIDYVDREIIALVAKHLKSPKDEVMQKEMPPATLFGRIAEIMAYSSSINPAILDVNLPVWQIPISDTGYLAGLEYVIKELAKNHSLVIRGRGSQFILKNNPDSFHVYTVAPLEIRIKRVANALKVDEETAKKEIHKADSSRREFIKRYFNAEMEDPIHYDMVLNTSQITYENASSVIATTLNLINTKLPRGRFKRKT